MNDNNDNDDDNSDNNDDNANNNSLLSSLTLWQLIKIIVTDNSELLLSS